MQTYLLAASLLAPNSHATRGATYFPPYILHTLMYVLFAALHALVMVVASVTPKGPK